MFFVVLSLVLSGLATARGEYASVLAEQLNQYCELHHSCSTKGNVGRHAPRIGKAGPRGPAGSAGRPGVVNYTRVEEAVQKELAGSQLQRRITELAEKLSTLEQAFSKQQKKDCVAVTRSDAEVWNTTGGVFDIYPGASGRMMKVYCDLITDGGGWIVFQRRMDGSENFERNWAEYVAGFGRQDGEFWLGLEKLHRITSQGSFELRVDLDDWDGNHAYALYTTFSIGDAGTDYVLRVGGYSGTAGDSLSYHDGQKFATVDKDNARSCVKQYKGPWWHNNCYYSNLNGVYETGGSYKAAKAHAVEWWHWRNAHWYSVKTTEMKIRPKY